MIIYALCFGLAAVGMSFLLAMRRVVSGSGLHDGEWLLDMIPVNAVVMIALLGVCVGL
jgi:multisubunit Na+/H+ antiporter MnhF subunit